MDCGCRILAWKEKNMSNGAGFTRGWCSPERYVQGPGEFDKLRFYTDKFGKTVAAFVDRFLYGELSVRLENMYAGEGHSIRIYEFNSEVTRELINEKTAELSDVMPDVVVGIGGGKTIDVAKAVGSQLKKPFVIVPTIAATDAPTSSLSVLYDSNGVHQGEFFYDHSPSLLVVDSTIIANAPTRFLVSGMGDALATLIEADATRLSNAPNLVYHKDGGCRQSLAGRAIARECYASLMKYGVLAKEACDRNVVTEALENIIETNILLSGLGFENNDTAGAHSINDGLTAVENSHLTMHGEKVAFGCIVQLVAETADRAYLDEVLAFCMQVGLPVCLEDLHVNATDENIRAIARASMHSNWKNMPFDVCEDFVFGAVKTADSYGKAFRDHWNKR